MLILSEKIIFLLAVIASIFGALRAAIRISRTIARGNGTLDKRLLWQRLLPVLLKVITFQPVFRLRFLPSLLHGLVAWGFLYYLLVNSSDVLEGFIFNYQFPGVGFLAGMYRLGSDVLTIAILSGILALLTRRFIFKSTALTARQDILLHPLARAGIARDSAIVGIFILFHVSSRFMGESLQIALHQPDPWQPFANSLSKIWIGLNPQTLIVGEHIAYWFALGTILVFIPYFLYSKHLHLIIAPINFLLKPQRRSLGELDRLDFEDESIEQFGVLKLEELGWEQIMDAYACIMCYRCQQACPAYHTGKLLSPAALEINKRYSLNVNGARLAHGEASQQTLLEFAIPPQAIWACTTCGACIDICPVGNEPMRDILDIRRALVLMENDFPEQQQNAFRGMERTVNPWNVPSTERMQWAQGLHVPTIEQNPTPDILWWVGCAPATDPRAKKIARAFAQILHKAGVNFAVLGEKEQCTGDSARRAGNEYLFNELATSNVEMLNQVAPPRIVTTCPHCLHTLKNEYPAFGGNYQVLHHSQLIDHLASAGKLKFKANQQRSHLTYHDPCYLSRHNHIVDQPRQALIRSGANLVEMPAHGRLSFCCGGGGAQMWKEEEQGTERVNAQRFHQAASTHADALAVACPFCMIMLTDASQGQTGHIQVLDVAEIVLQALEV